MIKELITALQADSYYGVDELIDFAKGRYYAPKNLKEANKLIKRNYYGVKGGDN